MKDLKYILSARWIALLGGYFQSIILPILIFNMNDSAVLLSATYVAETLPWIIIAPILIPVVNKFVDDKILVCINPLFKAILVFLMSIYIYNYYVVIIIFIFLGILNSMNASYNMKITRSSIPQNKIDKFTGIILGVDDVISVIAPVMVTFLLIKNVSPIVILRYNSIMLIISFLLLTKINLKTNKEESNEEEVKVKKTYLIKDSRLNYLTTLEFLRSVAEGVFTPLLIVYFKECIIATDEFYSFSQTLICLFQIIFSFLYIKLSQHISKKNIILIGTLNICIALLIIINIHTVAFYFIACCFLGIGMSLRQLVAENLLMFICTDENISVITTKYNSLVAFGYLIGYSISLIQINKYIVLYFLFSLVLIIISLFIGIKFKENINESIIKN